MHVALHLAGSAGTAAGAGTPLQRALAARGLVARPTFPRAHDPQLAAFAQVQVADRATADWVVAAVAPIDAVLAAYPVEEAEPA